MTARRLTLAAMAALSVLLGMAGLTNTALAAQGHVFLSSFGSFASFAYPQSVAIDDSTGDVYVLDVETGSVARYTASGEPAPFPALGSNELMGFTGFFASNVNQVAVDNSNTATKGDVYVTDSSSRVVDIFAPDGTQIGTVQSGNAVCGVAVDPAGHFYMSELQKGVNKYTPTANPVKAEDLDSSLSGASLGRNCNLAIDSHEDIYVSAAFEGQVQKFDALQFGSPTPIGTPISVTARGIAVDPSSDVLYLDLGEKIVEYNADGDVAGELHGEQFSDSTGIGINGANGDVYVADRASKQVYRYSGLVTLADVTLQAPSALTETSVTLNASVNPLGLSTTCKLEYGASPALGAEAPCSTANLGAGSSPVAVSADLSGLTPNTVYYYRFVITNPNGPEVAGGQFVSGSKPSIDSQSVKAVGLNEASIKAQINPNHFATTFHVEYGLDSSYGSVSPIPDSNVGSSSSDQTVVWGLAGLAPATTYHFRFVATDAFGVVYGPDGVFTTYEDKSIAAGACANTVLRQAQGSSYLPDCRAYELVSPVSKGSASISADPTKEQASTDGEAIKYVSPLAFGELQGTETPGAEYIGRRGTDGWSVQSINPLQKAQGTQEATSHYEYLTPDLSAGVFYAISPVGSAPSNVAQTRNLYLRNDLLSAPPGSYELLSDSTTLVPYAAIGRPFVAFGGGSEDLTHIAFESSYNLTDEASGLGSLPKVYEWEGGTERLASILPDGKPTEGTVGRGAGGSYLGGNFSNFHPTREAVSRDGSHIVFTASPFSAFSGNGGMGGNLYVRIDHSTTVQLNASERSEADPNGFQPAYFEGATPDGSKVLFTTDQALTDDAPVGTGTRVYMYDFGAPEGKRLTLISKDSEPSDNAHSSQVAAVSEDGSYVYFADANRLMPGMPSSHQPLLYVWHDGQLRAILAEGGGSFRLTRDGRRLAFVSNRISTASLVHMSNLPNDAAQCGEVEFGSACSEVYLYDYGADGLTCVSCQPAGDAPSGDSMFERSADTPLVNAENDRQNRVMSDDGRYLFFDSNDKLVPQAVNGRWNVYEYDSVTGEVHIISSGSCGCESLFVDASPDGRNIFFTTRQRLLHPDIDDNADLYDARVEGGIARQNEPLISPCTGESCQLPASNSPLISVPASATFSGVVGVPDGPAKSAVKRKVKPKPKAKPKHKHKAKPKHRAKPKRSARHTRHGRKSAASVPAGRSTHRTGR